MSKIKLVIIGGGIVGTTIALEAANSERFKEIILIEKEKELGFHSSTRNSGVIHSGFYYSPESNKAMFCSEGNKLLRKYCLRKKIKVNKCGKVVVSKNSQEDEILYELHKRGNSNNCNTKLFESKYLFQYEKYAITNNNFLWSPNTWSACPKTLFKTIIDECISKNVKFLKNTTIKEGNERRILTLTGEKIEFDYLINAAGGYALKLAESFGNNFPYILLPFKGLYLKSEIPIINMKRHIYPVPNLGQPFLGIHTTLTHDNYLKIGPTAIPCFSPENYSLFEGIDTELIKKIIPLHLYLLLSNEFGFRDLAFQESKYIFKNEIIKSASKLTSLDLRSINFKWHSPGIRAQLYDKNKKNLEFDFILKKQNRIFHLLNSISPAWTCSLKTAKEVINNLLLDIN